MSGSAIATAGRGRALGGEARNQPAELGDTGAEFGGQLLDVHVVGQMLERLGERPVRSLDDRVARAVQDERAVAGGASRELAHQPALSRPGLAADQDDPEALAGGARKQRAQLLELGRAADERKRRREAKRGGQVVHGEPVSTIVRSDYRFQTAGRRPLEK